MCGIFGTLNFNSSKDQQYIYRDLFHRGPDEQRHVEQDNLELYHTRLAIQDLTDQGQQPMKYEGLTIVFNGEIYNHLDIRKKYGLQSSSSSDTKTILMLYKLIGMKMLEEFDGMFAFALYDSIKKKLYLARDRAGKKPLYVYVKGLQCVFSSELNILSKVVCPEIDYASIADYLYLGYHYRKATPYQGVSELENGCYLEIDTHTNLSKKVKWFDMATYYQKENRLSYPDAMERLDHHLHLAIKRRIDSSDLDVGAFLSGGIDSGLVTSIAAEHTTNLKTFTVKVEGSYDESHLAQKVAQKYSTNHTVVDITFSDLQKDIEKILINHGEPNCDNSAIPSYYVAKEAKKHITVVLNGDGADELFGGYRRYVPFKHYDFFNSGKVSTTAAKMLTSILPIANEKQSSYNYLYRLLKLAGYDDLLKVYNSASCDLFVGFEEQFIHKPLMKELSADLMSINQMPISSLKKIILTDFQSMLFSRLLPKMDIATMAHSLEGRSPFLSKEILEFAPGLQDHFKINKFKTKPILRDLAIRYLPADLINQPKRGFEIPLKSWVNGELKAIINDYLLAPDALYAKIIKKSFIEDLLNSKVKISDERRAKILFCIFGLEVWFKGCYRQ
ncbi:asparagine synthase (glutamine-hydrolyzing) [Pedobacter sp. N36a]|uniref:asparagine synthase (glutamine-hydrolyzing) n=1 Tax=Pedobacter sp. N36a TaxID=2767996 RepID=UPI0016573525|nr:asparagine synthase (glutamine-hydrolyzing) [Pedobacter sp. N36a]MBC8986494.1 asparagine synthase (glutamine-hydrolyzing) [Pedobacter sp. N36a]